MAAGLPRGEVAVPTLPLRHRPAARTAGVGPSAGRYSTVMVPRLVMWNWQKYSYRPGVSKALGYRGHFGRMGFDAALSDLEARRDRGAPESELINAFPVELARLVGYFGPASGAAAAFRRLAEGLDTAIVRVVPARPGLDAIHAVMDACQPSRLPSI